MKHKFKKEFIEICNVILKEDKSVKEWSEIESDDMFQKGQYIGGFDATEMEFCFSVFVDGEEHWFQLTLNEIGRIANNKLDETLIRKAEY